MKNRITGPRTLTCRCERASLVQPKVFASKRARQVVRTIALCFLLDEQTSGRVPGRSSLGYCELAAALHRQQR